MQTKEVFVECPHCGGGVLVALAELNCRIFRHAVFKTTGQPIPPHASEVACKTLIARGLVEGCAKPFKIVEDAPAQHRAEACPYI